MKGSIFYRIIFILGIILIICFNLGCAYDCYMYIGGEYAYLSSPLYLYIVIRALTLLLPGVICMLIAYVLRPRAKKSGEAESLQDNNRYH